MKIKIKAKKVLQLLLATILILLILNVIVLVQKFYFNLNDDILYKLFNFDEEHNFPAFYSSLSLFACAIILAFISYINRLSKNSNSIYWFFLSLCFLYISIDESIQIHERIGGLLSNKYAFDGYLYYAWVIPYGFVLLVFGTLFYFNFLRHLPKKFRTLFVVSGVVFVTGALGFEMLGAHEVSSNTSEKIISIFYTIEEFLEMLGIALFLYALILYINEELCLKIKSKKTASKNEAAKILSM